jgi:phosphate transport system substrate-binding protein
MGYATAEVKMLKVKKTAGEPAYAPTVENTLNQTYPIARPLFIYTLGEPSAVIQKYLDWIHAPAGQEVVLQTGYVPLNMMTAK